MSYSRTPFKFGYPGHRFDGLPLEVVGQVGAEGITGIQYYFNHFYRWEGPTSEQAAPGTGGWICSVVDTGAANAEVIDVLDSNTYGVLRMVTNSADNDVVQLQLNGSAFQYTSGKRLWCFARIRLQDANDGEVFFGLALEGDTNVFSTFPTDGIFFEKSETATDFDFHVRKNGSSTEDTTFSGQTLADSTWYEIGLVVDASGNVTPYFDGTAYTAVASGATNIPDDEDLTLYMAVQTGAAATRYIDFDWILVAQER